MTEQHVPVERLAAYAAGDLDATAAVEVEAHVALCADCRADADAVRRAAAALAGLPPVTMPADVAARVDAAVAAAGRATGAVGDVLPMAPRRRSRPSLAGIAAVAACLALAGAITVPLVTGRDSAMDGGAAGTAASAPERAVQTRRLDSGLNYTSKTLGPTLTRALSGSPEGTAALEQTSGTGAPPAATAPRAQADSVTSAPAPSGVTIGAPPGLNALQGDPGRLAACVASLASSQPDGLGTTPLLVDFARFDGDPALVVVFPTVTRGQVTTDRADVWVVGPGCGTTPGDDHVLVFERIDRPAGL